MVEGAEYWVKPVFVSFVAGVETVSTFRVMRLLGLSELEVTSRGVLVEERADLGCHSPSVMCQGLSLA